MAIEAPVRRASATRTPPALAASRTSSPVEQSAPATSTTWRSAPPPANESITRAMRRPVVLTAAPVPGCRSSESTTATPALVAGPWSRGVPVHVAVAVVVDGFEDAFGRRHETLTVAVGSVSDQVRGLGDAAVVERDQHALGARHQYRLVVLFLQPVPRCASGGQRCRSNDGMGDLCRHHEGSVKGPVVKGVDLV